MWPEAFVAELRRRLGTKIKPYKIFPHIVSAAYNFLACIVSTHKTALLGFYPTEQRTLFQNRHSIQEVREVKYKLATSACLFPASPLLPDQQETGLFPRRRISVLRSESYFHF